ncbi:TetR/AcrR family transcriptional regulator [Halanaerobium hydrogeniformans]|uniref:Transcriptional regulator, TetR family n=1 Tax=Halanaerobium hydrogeniformans TaxID=656519 RepID=E4RPV8_HALHG|nr:TetR/AcrR family transcriptional regulator [Halanaerobium hydrogeniformans]ADQ14325.1 transcriptional regulator, TetR family [Halanaerobium hydrogeniformans]
MAKKTKKSLKRRNTILREAEKLFIEEGFEKATVKEIAERAGVAKGTFYYYFDTKEDIINALLGKRYNHTEKKAQHILESDKYSPLEKLEKVILRLIFTRQGNFKVYEFFKIDENAKFMKKRNKEFWNKFIPVFTEIVKEGVEAGVFETDYPEELTEILFMGIDGFLHRHYAKFTTKEMYQAKFCAVEELLTKALNLKGQKVDLSLMKPDN